MEITLIHYLAYGSNLHPYRLEQRGVHSAKPIGVVQVPGRRLAFHKRSQDVSGKCLFSESDSAQDIMYGFICELDAAEKDKRDFLEGLGKGYNDHLINVLLNGEAYQAYVYVAASSHTDASLAPYDWYREMVLLGDSWTTKVRLSTTERSQKADKALTHMPTSEEHPLSYAQLSELRRIITENRALFDQFLPPEKIWDARMDEIAQVRHRVAHFRKENEHDLDRVVNLLRDIDKGFWKFATSYNDNHPVLPQTDDPVVAHFLPFDLLPWAEIENGKLAQVGSIPRDAWFGMTVTTTLRPWAKWEKPVAGREGILYDVTMLLRGSTRHFDFPSLLKATRRLHKHFVHICLGDHADHIRVTIPAVLGEKLIIEILEGMIEMARSCAYPGDWPRHRGTIKSVADVWPEYVLEPGHALTLLTSDMPCSIFGV